MPRVLVDTSDLIRAVKDPSNYKPIIFCTVSLATIGVLMIVLGLVIIMLDHIDLGPPHFDNEYERYVGSSMPHILGPMFLAFGTLIMFGNILVLLYASSSYYFNRHRLASPNEGACRKQDSYLMTSRRRSDKTHVMHI